MDTPELEQLYRRYQRYEHLATHYRTVIESLREAEVTADPGARTVTLHTTAFQSLRKSIPHGKPMPWYVEKCTYYTMKANDAHDLYWSWHDVEQKRAWEALDRDGKLAQLRETAHYLEMTKHGIRECRTERPAWERTLELLRAALDETDMMTRERLRWHLMTSPPGQAIINTLEEALREREAERDWLMEHL